MSLGFTSLAVTVAEDQAFALLKAALSAGVNCWNGAEYYGTRCQLAPPSEVLIVYHLSGKCR